MRPNGLLGAVIVGSIRHRFMVLGLALLLGAFGVTELADANYDVFPDFAPPQASIQIEAPGLSADQIETIVTRPVEAAILGAADVAAVRSNSIQGLSTVTVVFGEAADPFRARQRLAEAISGLARQLPEGVEEPRLTQLTSSTGTVMIAGLTSDVVSLIDLRTIAEIGRASCRERV